MIISRPHISRAQVEKALRPRLRAPQQSWGPPTNAPAIIAINSRFPQGGRK